MTAWAVVALVGLGTFALKAAGPVLLGGRRLPARARAALELMGPALLAALVVTEVFGGDRSLVADHRVLGLAAAVVALLLRAPTLAVIVSAAAVTALARALL